METRLEAKEKCFPDMLIWELEILSEEQQISASQNNS